MAVRKPTPPFLRQHVDPQLVDLVVPQTAVTLTAAAVATLTTDSTGGTTVAAAAAGVGVQQINLGTFPLTSMANADIVTDFVPGYRFKLLALDAVTVVPATTASKASTLHLEIGSTAVGAGTCALTTAGCNARGKLVAGAAITSANTGSASAAISVVGASTTAFGEGSVTLIVTIQNMDIADAFTALIEDLGFCKTSADALVVDVAAIEALLDAAGVST